MREKQALRVAAVQTLAPGAAEAEQIDGKAGKMT